MQIANPESMNSVAIPKKPRQDNLSSTLSALASSFGTGIAGPQAIDPQTGEHLLRSWANDIYGVGAFGGQLANAMLDGTMLKMAGQAIQHPGETAQALGHGILETANLYGAGFGDAKFDLGRGIQFAAEHPFSTYLLFDGLRGGTQLASKLADYGTREALNAAMRSESGLSKLARDYALRRYDHWELPPEVIGLNEPPGYSLSRLASRLDGDVMPDPFSTHPPIKNRIGRLEKMAREQNLDIDLPLEMPKQRRITSQEIAKYDSDAPPPTEPPVLDDLLDPGYDMTLSDIDRISMNDPYLGEKMGSPELFQQLYIDRNKVFQMAKNGANDQLWSINNGAYRSPGQQDQFQIRSVSDVLRMAHVFANLFGGNTAYGWSHEPVMSDLGKKIWRSIFGAPHPF